jgi:hypothetical protein
VADQQMMRPFIVTKPAPWHWWVTIDLMCSSLGAGLFSVAALLYLFGGAADREVARLAFTIDFPIMLVDLVCLVFDLGDPYRFMNMMRVFKPGSPMSVGVWTIAIFSFLSFCAFIIAMLRLPGWTLTGVALAGLPFSLMVGIYKGVLFSTTAQPGWRTMRWLGAWFSISAGVLGLAGTLTIAAIERYVGTAATLRQGLLILMFLYAACLFVVDREAEESARFATASPLNLALAVAVGLVLPLLMVALATGALIDDLATAALIVGAIAIRHVLVMIPHQIAGAK